jgi:hypothetical protein
MPLGDLKKGISCVSIREYALKPEGNDWNNKFTTSKNNILT